MNKHQETLEKVANDFLSSSIKPNYTNRDFMNAVIIFQTALMDKMYDLQNYDNMPLEDREKMAISCGTDLHRLIHTYTGLDTFKVEDFL